MSFSKTFQSYSFGDQQLTEPLIHRHIHSLFYFNKTFNYGNCLSHRVDKQSLAHTNLNFRKNIRAEWTWGSHLLVINLSSRNVLLIITRTLFTLGQLHSGKSPTRNYSIYFAMFISVIPVKSYIRVTFMLLFWQFSDIK